MKTSSMNRPGPADFSDAVNGWPPDGKGRCEWRRAGGLYICGAKDQPETFKRVRVVEKNESLLEVEQGSEDTDALFFDADGDGDADLFVCSGGN